MTDVKQLYVEQSKANPQHKILICVLDDDTKYVVGGDPYYSTFLQPYDQCFNTQEPKKS